jgi:hypothetical protein
MSIKHKLKFRFLAVAALALIVSFTFSSCGTSGSGGDGNTAANTAPVAEAGPIQNVSTEALVTLDGSGSTDADGNAFTYRWSFTTKPTSSSTATLSSAIVSNPTFTADKDGAYVLSLVVNDGTVNSAADMVTITAATPFPGSANFRMPDTNQILSATTTTGEDSDYTINPPSYTDNLNGTVTDNVTALVWQQSYGGTMNWADAITYCADLDLGGQTDWRLPSRIELVSLLDHGNAITINDIFPTPFASFYWSSTPYADDTTYAWEAYFAYGNLVNGIKTQSTNYARCVRGGQ